MAQKKFVVLVIDYLKEDEKNVKKLIKNVMVPIDSKYGEAKLVYDGADERIVAALEKVLKLTE